MGLKEDNTSSSLKGLKVLELASVLAGPAVGMFLAELGAEVTKIENPKTGGDVTRNWKLGSEDYKAEHSAYFASVNWGKKHLFVDLSEPEDLKKVQKLANEAHVVISNYRGGQGEKYGLDHTSVSKNNPKVIYAQITGFGDSDSRPAFDVVLQAESGYMFMNGQPDSEPTKMPVAMIDVLAAHQLKEGILLALLKKEQKGKGALVSVSLLDAAISSLTNQATNWLMNGHIPQRMGSLHPNIAPYGEVLNTSDGKQIILAIGSEQHFRNLCEVLGLETLKEDYRFISNQERVKHRSQLFQLINKKAEALSSTKLMRRFADVNVPAGLIKNTQELFETESSKELLLRDAMTDGSLATRVSQIAFNLR